MKKSCSFSVQHEANNAVVILSSSWRIAHLDPVIPSFLKLTSLTESTITIDFAAITHIDTAGLWLITKLSRKWKAKGKEVIYRHIPENYSKLFKSINDFNVDITPPPPPLSLKDIITGIGRYGYHLWDELLILVSFIGEVTLALGKAFFQPKILRTKLLLNYINQVGTDAIFIIGLIAFLITIVVVYQGSAQLKQFGADIYTVNLAAISVLREMGVLLTAILIAGRSGSAFAAQIGTMKLSEEIDALTTMGLDPMQILVIPRVIAMLISLPLLTFLADILGLTGGWIMSLLLLDISSVQYWERVRDSINGWTLAVGLIKAPIFAYLISIVGCLRGLQVKGSAEHLGEMTTRAVVEAIFLVIIADAMLSILFFELGI